MITKIVKWGSRGKGVFMSAGSLSEFLATLDITESPSTLAEFLHRNRYLVGKAGDYFIGFHNEGHLQAARNFAFSTKPSTTPEKSICIRFARNSRREYDRDEDGHYIAPWTGPESKREEGKRVLMDNVAMVNRCNWADYVKRLEFLLNNPPPIFST